jgi:LPXTG-site transpeptidase (sortase) family protein
MSRMTPPSLFARRTMLGLLVSVLVLVAACGGNKKTQDASPPEPAATAAVFEATITPAATQEPAAAAEATPPAPQFPSPDEGAKLARLMIPSAKVNAPLQTKGRNSRGEMENPDGKDNVAWYDFTARPGFGSNAVFSGHVDWYTGEKGVFWGLRDLKVGDEIAIKLSDGMELKYKVVRNEVYKAEAAPVEEILGETAQEAITLITCDGVFNKRTQDYSDRRVVRAERIA